MANKSDSNPIFLDTASAACGWTNNQALASYTATPKRVLQVQHWDNNADVADNNNIIMVVNGVTLEITMQKTTDVGYQDPVVNILGPFTRGIPISELLLTTMTKGNLIIWLE